MRPTSRHCVLCHPWVYAIRSSPIQSHVVSSYPCSGCAMNHLQSLPCTICMMIRSHPRQIRDRNRLEFHQYSKTSKLSLMCNIGSTKLETTPRTCSDFISFFLTFQTPDIADRILESFLRARLELSAYTNLSKTRYTICYLVIFPLIRYFFPYQPSSLASPNPLCSSSSESSTRAKPR